MNGVVVLLEMDCTIGYSIRSAKCAYNEIRQVTYTMEHFSPFMGDPAPKVNRHTTTVCADRHIVFLSLKHIHFF
jgi:hypothetical protein